MWRPVYGACSSCFPCTSWSRRSTNSSRQLITHPEYYYGFAGVTLAWQILFFLIANNPIKYRTIMLIAILEKLSYGLAVPLLFVAGRVPSVVLLTSLPDLIWAALFAIAYRKTPFVSSL